MIRNENGSSHREVTFYMFALVSNGCPDGYAFVRDHYGNKSYYGTIEDCKRYIKSMEKEYQRYINQLKRRFIK